VKVLIAYFSLTGNTAQIATAIADEVSSQGHEADLKEIREVTAESLNGYDLVFLGAACHDSDLARPAKGLLADLAKAPGFKLAGFVTHATGMPDQGERWQALYERWAGACLPTFQRACAGKQIAFLGFFHCQGAPSPPIEAFIRDTIITDEGEWDKYVAGVRAHPDAADLENARAFARQMLSEL
jgi:flavodoxin